MTTDATPEYDSRKLKLQNRVDPWGKLHVTPERGSWMGNRGILHNDQKQIISQWQNYGWVTCTLDYVVPPPRTDLFTEGNYSELFFLDEATAFAAGHRPCAQCRNQRYKDFKAAWVAANRDRVSSDDPPIMKIDQALHNDRYINREKKTYNAPFETLPAGTMIEHNETAFLLWRGRVYRWSFAGYTLHKKKLDPSSTVRVLTPESVVKMFSDGFVPQVHVSVYR